MSTHLLGPEERAAQRVWSWVCARADKTKKKEEEEQMLPQNVTVAEPVPGTLSVDVLRGIPATEIADAAGAIKKAVEVVGERLFSIASDHVRGTQNLDDEAMLQDIVFKSCLLFSLYTPLSKPSNSSSS